MSFHKTDPATGKCLGCQKIMDRYPGLHKELRIWFESFQFRHFEAHISDAGRGCQDQEAAFLRGSSKARWGQSAHNWNCALDIFVLNHSSGSLYPLKWYQQVLANELPTWLEWYGRIGAPFYELPHVEVRGWRQMAKNLAINLVEPIKSVA